MTPAHYNDSVFINCPFDKEYVTFLHCIIFTIYRCGFIPVCALMEDDGSDNRLDKIVRCIEKCRYSIHDISRIELSNGFPRFNMPFELGIFFGAKRFGNKTHKTKNALIFEKEKFTYHKSISDLSGMDTKAHSNDADTIIKEVREWLFAASRRKTIPYYPILQSDYKSFIHYLSVLLKKIKLVSEEISFNDYCQVVEEFIAEQIRNTTQEK